MTTPFLALTRDVAPSMVDCELTHLERTPIDVARARAAKERAEEQLRKEHTAEVESDLRRAHARLSAAGGLGAAGH